MTKTEPNQPIEVEQKFFVDDAAALQQQLLAIGAIPLPAERHADTYYQHPAKDFAATREALRIRRVQRAITPSPNQSSHDPSPPADILVASETAASRETAVTYKGPYQASGVKARAELEWQLEPSDPDGRQLDQLFRYLGFTPVMTVCKTRRPFQLSSGGRQMTVTIDDADAVGLFAEVETIASDARETESCRQLVAEMADRLGLHRPQPKSYLRMALERAADLPADGG